MQHDCGWVGYDHALRQGMATEDITFKGRKASQHSDGSDGSLKRRRPGGSEKTDTRQPYPNNEKDGGVESKRTHPRTLGKLKLRSMDDDAPSDWWFASTAIPLIAATLAPMANLLSIAALVVFWRNDVTTDDHVLVDQTSYGIPDPAW